MDNQPMSPAEAAYYAELDDLHVLPFWRVAGGLQTTPQPAERPHVWHWTELYPQLQRAAELVAVGDGAERRVLTLRNPGRRTYGATHSLTTSLQLLMPGEVAPAHRHSMAALRFVIYGAGAYTVVQGEKLPMARGDLLLTPSWTWHDHGHEGAEPAVWLDGLDAPFVNMINQRFYEEHPGVAQQVLAASITDAGKSAGSAVPAGPVTQLATVTPSGNLYEWDQAYHALAQVMADDESDFDGAMIEYVHPESGGHVLPTIACCLQRLRPGQHTQAHRHTSSTVYFVCYGSGHSIVDGQRFDWATNDILAIPVWAWHEHVAADAGEVVLFSMTDRPILEPFGLYREEPYPDGQGFQR